VFTSGAGLFGGCLTPVWVNISRIHQNVEYPLFRDKRQQILM